MTLRRRVWLACLALAATASFAPHPDASGERVYAQAIEAAPRPPKPMTLVDLTTIPRINDPQLSPDGRLVAFMLGRADWKVDGFVNHIWVQVVGSGRPVQVTTGAQDTVARWSPDSKTLLFLTGNQISLVGAEGGAAKPLTHHATSVLGAPTTTAPTWTADGKFIYFVARDPAPASTSASSAGSVTIFEENDFTQQHIWKVNVATGAEERVTSGDWSVLSFRLSQDGKHFVIRRADRPLAIDHYLSEIWIIDADGKNPRQLTNNNLFELDAELSPDNSQVWFIADANDKLDPYYGHAVFTMPAAGGTPRMLIPNLGHSVDAASWSPDGKAIFAVVNLGVHQEIYRFDVATRTATALTDGRHAISPSWNVVPAANRMIFQFDEPARLGDAWTLPLDGTVLTRVTGVYDALATDFALPREEKVTWKGADGVTIEGILFYPIGYQQGTRYPLVVQLHGGPADSDKFGFGPGFIFNYVPVLTARGYAVLRPNFRGSSGYGSAFVRDIIGHYFNNMHLDVMAGVDQLIKQGIVDPNRLAVMGTSAGAHLVNKLITFTDRFKAASSAAGVANWISLMGQTDAVARRTFWIGGTPWQKDAPIDLLWNNSPIKDVWKVKTPTIFVAGDRDTRVPLPQSQEMYRGLQYAGVDTKLITGAGEPHQWQHIKSQFIKANADLEWFEKYVMKRPYTSEMQPADVPPLR